MRTVRNVSRDIVAARGEFRWNMRALFFLVALVIAPVSLAGPRAASNEQNKESVAESPTVAGGERAAVGRSSDEQGAKGVDVRHDQSTRHWKLTTVRSRQLVQQDIRVEEQWIDLKTGESYRKNSTTVDGTEVLTNEAVFDGRWAMLVYHRESKVSFIDLSPLQCRMRKRLYKGKQLRSAYVGDPRQSKRFSKTGEEQVLGTQCEIWSGEVPRSNASVTYSVRAWLDSNTDELIRLETRSEAAGRTQVYALLERNRPIPAELLEMETPPGFTQKNTKATAPRQKAAWAGFGTGSIRVLFIFSLPDGSVLLASSLEGPNARSRMKSIVEDLERGDPLPSSSWILGSLRTIGLDEEIEFAGHHLTYTEDKDGCYEWSIHVARSELPDSGQYYGYAVPVIHGRTYTNGWLSEVDSSIQDTWKGFPIRHADEFRTFVTAAMREYSTVESESIHPDFEEVMKLVASLRESTVRNGQERSP